MWVYPPNCRTKVGARWSPSFPRQSLARRRARNIVQVHAHALNGSWECYHAVRIGLGAIWGDHGRRRSLHFTTPHLCLKEGWVYPLLSISLKKKCVWIWLLPTKFALLLLLYNPIGPLATANVPTSKPFDPLRRFNYVHIFLNTYVRTRLPIRYVVCWTWNYIITAMFSPRCSEDLENAFRFFSEHLQSSNQSTKTKT